MESKAKTTSSSSLVNTPLEVVHDIFRKRSTNGETNHQGNWGVPEAFGDLFSEDAYRSIPLLLRESFEAGALPHNSLVRFRGMVQDMFDPEYYAGVVPYGGKLVTSKYMDQLPHEVAGNLDGVGNETIFERLPVYCVPVPFETSWAKSNFKSRCKKQEAPLVDEGPEMKKRMPVRESVDSIPLQVSSKRTRENRMEEDNQGVAGNKENTLPASKTSEMTKQTKSESNTFLLNTGTEQYSPDQNVSDLPCLVKLYDDHAEPENTRLGVNQIVEVVGILSVAREFTEHSGDEHMEVEDLARMPPCSDVPRIHCIGLKVLTPCTVDEVYCSPQQGINLTDSLTAARSAAVEILCSCAGGDSLVAEYLLMWMVSRVCSRPAPGIAVGKLSLGLVGDKSHLASVPGMLEVLLSRIQIFDLSCQALCQETFNPKKDVVSNRLRSGRLQMAHGTHVVVNETALEQGQLDESGLRNLKSLDILSAQQQVSYDFQFFQKDWPTDTPVLVLSESPKSLVHTDAQVFVQNRISKEELEGKDLDSLRDYLLLVRSLQTSKFELSDEVSKHIQEDFVAARQLNNSLNEGSLHLWMTLARLRSLSLHEMAMQKGTYDAIRSLEKERMQRLPQEQIPQRQLSSPTSVHQFPGGRR